jgi:hypothetical protein
MNSFLFTYILVLIFIIAIYEWIMIKDRKNHREEVRFILERAELERKELTDRIMSKNLPEYKAVNHSKERTNPKNFMKSKIEDSYRYKD